MTVIPYIVPLVCIGGLLMFLLLGKWPKWKRVGEIMFAVGLFWWIGGAK